MMRPRGITTADIGNATSGPQREEHCLTSVTGRKTRKSN
jgi:hypothetical protein